MSSVLKRTLRTSPWPCSVRSSTGASGVPSSERDQLVERRSPAYLILNSRRAPAAVLYASLARLLAGPTRSERRQVRHHLRVRCLGLYALRSVSLEGRGWGPEMHKDSCPGAGGRFTENPSDSMPVGVHLDKRRTLRVGAGDANGRPGPVARGTDPRGTQPRRGGLEQDAAGTGDSLAGAGRGDTAVSVR